MINQSTPIINHLSALTKFNSKTPQSIIETEDMAKVAVKSLSLKVVRSSQYCFKPKGITVLFLLSQSHLAIHTWPEYQTIHADLLSCDKIKKDRFKEVLRESLQSFEIKSMTTKRCKI